MEMDIENALESRRTIRKFRKEKIPKDILQKIIEYGSCAPSACNRQRWEFIIIDDEKVRKRLIEEAKCSFFEETPSVVFVLYDKRINSEKYANIQSAAAAIQNMLLYSYSKGIGSWWIAAYGDESKVRKILGIPDAMMIVSAIGFGYPAEVVNPPKHRSLEDMIHHNRFKEQNLLSVDPADWTFEELAKFSALAIRATSPHIGYGPYFKRELVNEVDLTVSAIRDEVAIISLFDSIGNYTFEIAQRLKDKEITLYSMCSEVSDWLKERGTHLSVNNVEFDFGTDKFNYPDASFDCVLFSQSLNMLPRKDAILKEVARILKPSGKLILSIVNAHSFHGLYSRGTILRTGPVKPITTSEIKKLLKRLGFSIEKSVGLNLFPSPEILESKAGFVGDLRLKKIYPLINLISLHGRLESFKTETPIKELCRVVIYQCKNSRLSTS